MRGNLQLCKMVDVLTILSEIPVEANFRHSFGPLNVSQIFLPPFQIIHGEIVFEKRFLNGKGRSQYSFLIWFSSIVSELLRRSSFTAFITYCVSFVLKCAWRSVESASFEG